jgi:hypothetical protein
MSEECEDAYTNPLCPYVTQINKNTACVERIEKALDALLGADGTGLNNGAIHQIFQKLDGFSEDRKVTSSWMQLVKPVAISVVITAVTTYLFARFG